LGPHQTVFYKFNTKYLCGISVGSPFDADSQFDPREPDSAEYPAGEPAVILSLHIAIAADGTIGVSYYDFRFNNPNPSLPTDRWLVQYHPTSTSAATDPACWDNEVRVTDSSFNMEAVPIDAFGDFFFGRSLRAGDRRR
jgi:hypothetical protein